MKKIIPIITMALALTAPAHAQSIYKSILDAAVATSNNKSASKDEVLINTFKVDALRFLTEQAKGADDYFLDSQAASLDQFVSDYVAKTKSAGHRAAALQKIYKDANAACPLSPNAKGGDKYSTLQGTPTPFSLNCDWEKANDMASKKVKQTMK